MQGRLPYLILFATTMAGYAIPLFHWNLTPGLDWDYFSCFGLIVRSSILHYGTFPLHDPWILGGLDLLANPQTRIFSPWLPFDLLIPPYLADLLVLIVYALAGALGMYRLLKSRGLSVPTAVTGAAIFINASWFGLHFTEGHIAYGGIQLLPWVLYFLLRFDRPLAVFGYFSLLTLFLLDGGIYAFIFSVILTVLVFLVGSARPWTVLREAPDTDRRLVGLTILAAALLASAKIVPVLVLTADIVPKLDFANVTLSHAWKMFFDPRQISLELLDLETTWRFHEFGCYLGLLATAVILWQARSRTFLKENQRWLLLGAFFLWAGTGWGGILNPWHLFHKIPLFNNAHIQSRILILMFLFFVIVLASALEHLRDKRVRHALMLLLVCEAIFVKNYPFHISYQFARPRPSQTLIRSTTLRETVMNASRPEHYFSDGLGSLFAYEASAKKSQVHYKGGEGYRGEIYPVEGQGAVRLEAFTPGRIVLAHEGVGPLKIEVNSNFLAGWVVTGGAGRAYSGPTGLIRVDLPAGSGRVEVRYRPGYFPWILMSYLSGLLLWAGLAWHFIRQPRRGFAGGTA